MGRKYHKVTYEDIRKMRKLSNHGMKKSQISRELNVNPTTLYKYLGVTEHMGHKEPERTCNEAVKRYKVGQKIKVEVLIDTGKGSLAGQIVKGNVIFSNANHFVVEKQKCGKNLYPVSFEYNYLLTRDLKVEETM